MRGLRKILREVRYWIGLIYRVLTGTGIDLKVLCTENEEWWVVRAIRNREHSVLFPFWTVYYKTFSMSVRDLDHRLPRTKLLVLASTNQKLANVDFLERQTLARGGSFEVFDEMESFRKILDRLIKES